MRLRRELGLFAIGGIGGLLVDAGIVQALVSWAGWNAYLARGLSFLAAATFTWDGTGATRLPAATAGAPRTPSGCTGSP